MDWRNDDSDLIEKAHSLKSSDRDVERAYNKVETALRDIENMSYEVEQGDQRSIAKTNNIETALYGPERRREIGLIWQLRHAVEAVVDAEKHKRERDESAMHVAREARDAHYAQEQDNVRQWRWVRQEREPEKTDLERALDRSRWNETHPLGAYLPRD